MIAVPALSNKRRVADETVGTQAAAEIAPAESNHQKGEENGGNVIAEHHVSDGLGFAGRARADTADLALLVFNRMLALRHHFFRRTAVVAHGRTDYHGDFTRVFYKRIARPEFAAVKPPQAPNPFQTFAPCARRLGGICLVDRAGCACLREKW